MQPIELSSDYTITLPEYMANSYGLKPGLKFIVLKVNDGILLKPVKKPFKTTKIEDVIGCTGYKGSKKSLKDMEDAIAIGAKEKL